MPLGARPGQSPQLRELRQSVRRLLGLDDDTAVVIRQLACADDDDCMDDLLRWVAAGGPGLAQPSATLELHFIRPPGEARTRARGRGHARR
ncbi:hypothetical protein ACWEWX_12185 [Streptomyces asiaticus]